MKKRKPLLILGAAAAVLLLGVCGWLIWKYYPVIQNLTQPENMAAFREKLSSFGVFGILALFCIQVLQVISGIIPALPIQIAAGLTYGALGGLAICLFGIFCGSTLVFAAVKKYGQPLVDKVFPPQKQQKLSFLYDADRLGMIVFILYLIPAMPKDVFTYIAALTPLTLRRYLSLTLAARVPTILCLTFASDALMDGNYLRAVVVFCISAALGLCGMLFSKRIMECLRRLRKSR
ncbi:MULTISPECIES: TVP38/TMEM64 family protein [Anaerotruncus]|jgi:uncharacterized membrane protein YdjX (TVP38/TMEM64 family)|uniref:TVP38/TMEM64 family protein n=1 Tax=Anaerotruncus TaxID=244127 RepID=UPI0008350E40|nr:MULTISPECIES: VTT domain-containing protein [Anaerotruncus]RGX56055.1 TVP38/TMEM64 family protein [Anaerotruncus sp. AF02-27]